ncbi:amino acid adenylation domain-containing protein (plasmid) [Enterocloster clostridioformis]
MENKFKASRIQKKMFVKNLMRPATLSYNMAFSYYIEGKLDIQRLISCIKKVIKINPILTSRFFEENGDLYYTIDMDRNISIELIDCAGVSILSFIDKAIEEFIKPFNMEYDNLCRFRIVQFSEEKNLLLMDFHHSIYDGSSHFIICKQISAFYNCLEIKKSKYSYNDFVMWQENNISSCDYKNKKKYWKKVLSESLDYRTLFNNFYSRKEESYEVESLESVYVSKSKILEFCNKINCNPFSFYISCLNFVLVKLSYRNDIMIGAITSERYTESIKNVAGMFENILPLRNNVSTDLTVEEYIKEIQLNTNESLKNSDVLYEDILDLAQTNNNLFDILLRYQQSYNCSLQLNELSVKTKEIIINSDYNINIFVNEHNNEFEIKLVFAKEFYDKNTVEVLIDLFTKAIFCFIDSERDIVKNVSLIDRSQKSRIIKEFNDTYAEYPREGTVAELFEEQVRKTPDNIAVVYEDIQLTYGELNARANSLASRLRNEYGVKPDDFVAMVTERSPEMLAGILAIMKAGGAYVPVDPAYPEERIAYMLEDCAPKAVLAYKAEVNTDIPVIDLADSRVWEGAPGNLERVNKASDLAYCIYTSGTTGRPKGTMVEIKSVLNMLTHVVNSRGLNKNSIILQKTANVFDVSVWEIFAFTVCGGKEVLLKAGYEKEPDKIVDTIDKYKVTELSFVPSMFKSYISMLQENDPRLITLSGIQLAGEALTAELVKSYKGHGEIINFYGPTEATVYTTEYTCTKDNEKLIPIGKPISNTQVYILQGEELCGIGVPGELCIAGAGLARGYLNQPRLTAEKFVGNPYGEGRLYRSGDLARWLPDGNIEYLGRIDEQVKIRGFRIELGEIESRIQEIPGIKEAAVIAGENRGDKYICAYVVSEEEVDGNAVKDELRKSLPDYMIPAYIMQIEGLPVTRSGKLDRKALPEPGYRSAREYVAPRNRTETVVVNAFRSILGVERVSITDSFFDLGGDSIKAIRVASKIREEGYNTSVKAIMGGRTPENIAKGMRKDTATKAEQGEVSGEAPLTAIQKEFFESSLYNKNHFNQSMMYESAEKIDMSVLKKVLSKITEHHDMLRASYKDGRQTLGKARERQWYGIDEYSCSPEEIDGISSKLQGSLNIETGPLMKAGVFHTPGQDYLLLIIHHLAVDGVSWRIIGEDLENGYRQAKEGGEISLPEKTTSFKEWSEGIARYRNSYKLRQEAGYWNKVNREVAKGKVEKDGLKGADKPAAVGITLEREQTEALLRNSNRAYNTEINDLLLTALARAVNRTTGQRALAVELEGHGREEINEKINVERTVGWFTSVYPVVFENIGNEIGEDIRNTKETLRRVPNKGIGYGILKNLGEPAVKIGAVPDVTFNYLGEMGAERNYSSAVLRLTDMPHGMESDPANKFGTAISVNGLVQNGTLSMWVSYNESEYRPETVEVLCREFKEGLKEVAEHCQKAETVENTASDYGETEWTDEEYRAVKSEIEDKGGKIERIYPLTSMQEGMLYEKLANEESTQYVVQQVMKLKDLNSANMRAAFEALAAKHDILHTMIKYKGVNPPRQVLLEERRPEYKYIEAVSKEEYQEIKSRDVKRGFDLEEDTLIRMTVVRISQEEYRLILTNHHIIADGWCLSIIYGDLFRYYTALEAGQKLPKEHGGKYEEFVRHTGARDKEGSLGYWENLLEDYEEQANILPLGKADDTEEESIVMEASLTEEITRKAERLSGKYGVTVNTLIEAVWGIILQKYNGTDDVVFGKVVSGRNAEVEGIDKMVGLFINTVPVRVKTEKDDTYGMLVARLQEQAMEGNEHDYCSLAEIQSRSPLGNGLIGTIMAFENYYVHGAEGFAEFESAREQTSYGITLSVNMAGTLNLGIAYDTSKYGREEIELLIKHLRVLAENAINNPETKVADLQMLDDSEEERVIREFNDTYAEYPREGTVAELFEEQVRKTPDNIAVVYEDIQLTYGELNARANSLADRLRNEYGVKPDDFVAMVTERSPEMLAGILAIMKAGGAYVPVDPAYPEERIAYMLEDCAPKAVLAYKAEVNTDIPVIDLADSRVWEGAPGNLERVNKASDLAYCIYTSGTTGRPKGTMVEIKSVLNMLTHVVNSRGLNKNSIILQKTANVFDVSVWEIFAFTVCGGKEVLLKAGYEKEPDKIVDTIDKYKVTELSFVPSMFKSYISMLQENDPRLITLSGIQLAGEALTAELVKSYKGHGEIINFYGPTEATVYTTEYTCTKDNEKLIPIGKPISNTQVYILQGEELCGIGVPGELCIAGAGLARGYLNQPGLTAEKFVGNPYGEGRLYRSGDLARWLPDGNIEYLGRIDEQVKIRGFRIELGEIESRIQEIPGIKEAAVIAGENRGDKYICAYVVSEEEVDGNAVKDELRKSLPDYMIPAYIMQIEGLPVTRSGKLDRKALPEPGYRSAREYVAPRNRTETVVVNAFKAILGVERVSITDSFFDLGGDSIKAIKVVSILNDEKVDVRTILEKQTPERIANKIDKFIQANSVIYIMNQEQNINRSKPQLFLIPSIEGFAFCFENLVRDMKYDGAVYGINDPKFYISNLNELKEVRDYTINKMYQYINEFFRDGDILIGYSYGGRLAPLLAERLEQSNKKVAKVFILDTLVDNSDNGSKFLNNKDKIEFEYAKILVEKYLEGKKYNAKEYGNNSDSILQTISKKLSKNNEGYERIYNEINQELKVPMINAMDDLPIESKIKSDIIAIFTNSTIKEPEKCFEWRNCTEGIFEYYILDCEHTELITLNSRKVSNLIKKYII